MEGVEIPSGTLDRSASFGRLEIFRYVSERKIHGDLQQRRDQPRRVMVEEIIGVSRGIPVVVENQARRPAQYAIQSFYIRGALAVGLVFAAAEGQRFPGLEHGQPSRPLRFVDHLHRFRVVVRKTFRRKPRHDFSGAFGLAVPVVVHVVPESRLKGIVEVHLHIGTAGNRPRLLVLVLPIAFLAGLAVHAVNFVGHRQADNLVQGIRRLDHLARQHVVIEFITRVRVGFFDRVDRHFVCLFIVVVVLHKHVWVGCVVRFQDPVQVVPQSENGGTRGAFVGVGVLDEGVFLVGVVSRQVGVGLVVDGHLLIRRGLELQLIIAIYILPLGPHAGGDDDSVAGIRPFAFVQYGSGRPGDSFLHLVPNNN